MALTLWKEGEKKQRDWTPWGYNVSRLIGKTLVSADGEEFFADLVFTDTEGTKYFLGNRLEREGIEVSGWVHIADIAGDLSNLVGAEILQAEEVSSEPKGGDAIQSDRWTFYRFATRKGSVVVRFSDSDSDYYYSEWVDFMIYPEPKD